MRALSRPTRSAGFLRPLFTNDSVFASFAYMYRYIFNLEKCWRAALRMKTISEAHERFNNKITLPKCPTFTFLFLRMYL